MSISFNKLTLKNWRQFSQIDIDFHPMVTILTGSNGAGKSTLLRILSQHFGFAYPLLATPILEKDGSLKYLLGILDLETEQENVSQNKLSSTLLARV